MGGRAEVSAEQGPCSGLSVLCISAPLVMWAGLLLLSWCGTGSTAPQAVAALLLFTPEAADSVHGSAQAAEAAEASPHA